jgi:hypothetical protein
MLCDVENVQGRDKLSIIDIKVLDGEVLRGGPLDSFLLTSYRYNCIKCAMDC